MAIAKILRFFTFIRVLKNTISLRYSPGCGNGGPFHRCRSIQGEPVGIRCGGFKPGEGEGTGPVIYPGEFFSPSSTVRSGKGELVTIDRGRQALPDREVTLAIRGEGDRFALRFVANRDTVVRFGKNP